MFGSRKSDIRRQLLAGREVGTDISLSTEYDGMILTVKLGDEILTECTTQDAMFLFVALSHFLGKDTVKGLLKLRPDKEWRKGHSDTIE